MEHQTLQALLGKYLTHCKIIKNYSSATIKSYESTFSLLFKETKIKHLKDLNKKVLEDWFFNGRLNRKWRASTFRDHHKHINPFLKWLLKEGLIKENYLVDLEKPRLEHRLPRTLTKDEAEKILETVFNLPYPYRFAKFRNRALVAIMLLAGLRRNETLKLKLNDVSLNNSTIFISQGKWSKDRMVPINNRLNIVLAKYLQQRQKLGKTCTNFFISTQRDQAMGEKAINNLMRKLRKATGIDFSAHTLRHGFARLMLEGGCDIYTLSKLMGHSKITTTTIYLSCSSRQMSKSIEMHSLN